MKIKNSFYKLIYTFVWIAMIATASVGVYSFADQGNAAPDKTWGVVSIENPIADELLRLEPGDRILLKEKVNVNFDNVLFKKTTVHFLGSTNSLGIIQSWGKEFKVYHISNYPDSNLPISIENPWSMFSTSHEVWVEPELIAEITYLKKLKEPRIVRRAYIRIQEHRTYKPMHTRA